MAQSPPVYNGDSTPLLNEYIHAHYRLLRKRSSGDDQHILDSLKAAIKDVVEEVARYCSVNGDEMNFVAAIDFLSMLNPLGENEFIQDAIDYIAPKDFLAAIAKFPSPTMSALDSVIDLSHRNANQDEITECAKQHVTKMGEFLSFVGERDKWEHALEMIDAAFSTEVRRNSLVITLHSLE